MRNTLLIVSYS